MSTRFEESYRQELLQAVHSFIKGDELVAAKLDRLNQTQVAIINQLSSLQASSIHIVSLACQINTRAIWEMVPLVVGLLMGRLGAINESGHLSSKYCMDGFLDVNCVSLDKTR